MFLLAEREEEEDRKQVDDLKSTFRNFVLATETHEPLQPGVTYLSGASGAHGRYCLEKQQLLFGTLGDQSGNSFQTFLEIRETFTECY